ncbi:hypothetical protein MTsPCn5_18650 [Croceitalea sp. MTPC5]|nr:hypothetical protein MTsPCn5_18650 [Croceitalea sp. MTPC5]
MEFSKLAQEKLSINTLLQSALCVNRCPNVACFSILLEKKYSVKKVTQLFFNR